MNSTSPWSIVRRSSYVPYKAVDLTLFYSGECIVHHSGSDAVSLDMVVLPVQSDVNHLLVCSSHEDVPSVHVSMFKLKSLGEGLH